jgi:hypothetical protein
MAKRMKVPRIVKEPEVTVDKRGFTGEHAKMPVRCATCRNWQGGTKCRAFPNGIPKDILKGKHDHIKPFPGDHGIRYEPDIG